MSRDSFLTRTHGVPGNTSSHKRSKAQEKELAKRFGARTTIASGAFNEKGDVRLKGVVRIEAKTTKHKSFSITLDMLKKIEDAALPFGEFPAIVVEFNDGAGNKLKDVAVIPTYVLGELIHGR